MSKHTPGPWEDAGRAGLGRMVRAGTKEDPRWICVVYGEGVTPESQANARLIAAAPELLEAMKNLVNGGSDGRAKDWDLAEAAIRKAEGRS